MTNEVATIDSIANVPASGAEMSDEERAAIMALTGQKQEGGGGNTLPRLSINYDAEWADENNPDVDPVPLKRGHYKLSVDGVTGYAKTARFRPLHKTYRYSVYDQKNNTSALNTTQFKDWQEVVYDDRGAELKANRYKAEAVKLYPGDANDIKCSRTMYGLATLVDAKDMHGNPVEMENIPCMWFTKGASFMPVAEVLDSLTNQGKLMQNYEMVLSSRREKNGGTTFFVVEAEWDTSKELPFDADTVELLKKFLDTVDSENKGIIKEFKKKKNGSTLEDIASEFSGDDLSSDFDDDVDI